MFCSYLWHQLDATQDDYSYADYSVMTQASISLDNAVDSLGHFETFPNGDSIEIEEYAAKVNAVEYNLEAYRELLSSTDLSTYDYASDTSDHDNKIFWIKVIFSFLFAGAALYVVLSNKYDDDTKKWAFNVLTLISGIWIGAVSTVV